MLTRRPQSRWQQPTLRRAAAASALTAAVAVLSLPGLLLPASLVLLAGMCWWILPSSETLVAATVVAAGVVGSYVTVRLGTSPERIAALLTLAVVIGSAVHLVLTRSADRLFLLVERHAATLLGIAVVLRAVPLVHGYAWFQTGRLGFVEIGEFTRPMVAAVFAVWTVTASRPRPGNSWSLRTLVGQPPALLAVGYLAELLAAQDLGPAVLTCTGLAVVLPWQVRSGRQRIALLVGLTLGALILVATVPIIHARVLNTLTPAPGSQLHEALSTTSWGGFFGDGSSPFVSLVPVAASDMLAAVTIGLLGAVPYAVLLLALVVSSARLLRRADRVDGAARAVSVALTTMQAMMIVWTATANIALGPLSGISQPFSTMTGSSIVPSVAVLGAVAALTSGAVRQQPVPGSRLIRRLAGVLAVPVSVVVVIGTLLCAVFPARPSDRDLTYFPRGEIRTADGQIIAKASDGHDARSLVSSIYAEVGTLTETPDGMISAFGVETMQVRTLACGGADRLDVLESINRPVRCHPAGIVLTMAASVQQAAVQALRGEQGEAAVLDTDTGGVVAEYATSDTAPTVPVPDGGVESAARNGGSAPGSVMKLVTAGAALRAGVDVSKAPRALLEFSDRTQLQNENGFVCPESTIEAMIAFSCNTVAGYLADQVGAHDFEQVASRYFGFDRTPSYDGVPNAYDGGRFLAGTTGLAGASAVDEATLARTGIGLQGVRANVLALAQVGEVLLRGGRLSPAAHIVAGSCTGSSFRAAPVVGTVAPDPLPADIAHTIRHGMRLSVEQGTATALRSFGPDIAAKTGTSDVIHQSDVVTTDETIIVLFEHYAVAVIVHLPYEGSSSAAVDSAATIIRSLVQAPRSVQCR